MKTPEKLTEQAVAAAPDAVLQRLAQVLDEAGLSPEERVEALGGAFVTEAVRPHWGEGRDARAAHQRMRRRDPELADSVEALSPMLLGRVRARVEAAKAISEVERLLGRR